MIASAIPTRWTLTLAAWATLAVCALIVPASAAEPERDRPSAARDAEESEEARAASAEAERNAAEPAEQAAPAPRRPEGDVYRLATVYPDSEC